jgi:hypothetical protein
VSDLSGKTMILVGASRCSASGSPRPSPGRAPRWSPWPARRQRSCRGPHRVPLAARDSAQAAASRSAVAVITSGAALAGHRSAVGTAAPRPPGCDEGWRQDGVCSAGTADGQHRTYDRAASRVRHVEEDPVHVQERRRSAGRRLGAQERPPRSVQMAGLASRRSTVQARNSGAVQAALPDLGDVPCREAPAQDRGESLSEFCIGSPIQSAV